MPRSDRKEFDSSTPEGRFGLHFRALVDATGLTVPQLKAAIEEAGRPVSLGGIRHWLRGDSYPDHAMMEVLGPILGLLDYRLIMPPAAESTKVPASRRRPAKAAAKSQGHHNGQGKQHS